MYIYLKQHIHIFKYIYIYMFKYLVEKLTTYWNTKNDTPISWPQPLLAMVQQFRHHPGPPKQRRMEESKHRFIFWPPKCRHLTFTCHKGHSKFKPLRTHASEPTQNQLCIYIYIYLKQHIYIAFACDMFKYLVEKLTGKTDYIVKHKEWHSNLLASAFACDGAAIPSSSGASEATENGRK